jgi:hypothetical protein
MRLRQFVPPAFAGFLLGSSALGLFFRPLWSALALVLALYALADVAATAALGRAKGWRYAPRLLIIHPILHLSYGLGFLAGLARFAGQANPPPAGDRSPAREPTR